ncbi:hypothetical protein ACIU1J_19115 [Azospirillum doebereinerae]|uniref:hypothetical protein n=1 Tax=Azospirillum doebereinerae TaxID=92933 RepID=UPI00384E4A47
MEPSQAFQIDNVQISISTHWWGFELHLNEDAVQLLETIRDLAERLAKLLDPELAPVIKLAILIEKEWIKLVDQGNGVKLVSPWVSPTMLIPLPDSQPTHVDDNSLYWTVYDPAKGWSEDVRFPANHAEVGPALASFGGRLMCVHRGAADDSFLLRTTHDPDQGWSRDQRFPAHVTSSEPAMAVFRDRLYCVHKGDGGDSSLWWTTFDGTAWSQDQCFPAHLSATGPAVTVFGDRLVCLHRGAQSDDSVFSTAFDGTSWSPDRRLPLHTTSKVAVAAFQGRLHCVHRNSDGDLWWATTADGTNWETAGRLYTYTSSGPALAVYNDRLHCVYVGGR